jgi:uncharacterized Zn-binding protein involved in type VI secretion
VIVVGFPTVLIGMLPAARIGDNHVCPMVTPGVPPVPHVGGPFIMGSPTVLVGNMPQSRVTDQLVCVGPPDMAIMGEPTVLVGMVGAGGLASAMQGLESMNIPVPMNTPNPSTSAAAGAPSATLLSDGTMMTSAPPGCALPPITLSQPGWPDLPANTTATFESVQPVTLPSGTTLYAPSEEDAAGQSLWSIAPPGESASEAAGTIAAEVGSADGVRAWMGQPANPNSATKQLQVWVPPTSGSAIKLKHSPRPQNGFV